MDPTKREEAAGAKKMPQRLLRARTATELASAPRLVMMMVRPD